MPQDGKSFRLGQGILLRQIAVGFLAAFAAFALQAAVGKATSDDSTDFIQLPGYPFTSTMVRHENTRIDAKDQRVPRVFLQTQRECKLHYSMAPESWYILHGNNTRADQFKSFPAT